MQNINFYDPSLRFKRDWTGAGAALGALATAAGVAALAGFWVRHEVTILQAPAAAAAAARQAKHDALAVLEARRNGLKADAALERRLLGLQATLVQRRAALQLLGQGTLRPDSGYSNALLALARQSVDGLWLTGLAIDNGGMTLRGRTFRPELIAVYVGRLNGEAALQGQSFRALDVQRPADETAAAVAAEAQQPAPPAPRPAARRLAPYVEFSLTAAREPGVEAAAAGSSAMAASAVGAGAPPLAGSRS